MFAIHTVLKKAISFLIVFVAFFSVNYARGYSVSNEEFDFIKNQCQRIYEAKEKLDKLIKHQKNEKIFPCARSFEKHAIGFILAILGKKELANIDKRTVSIISFHENGFLENLISNTAFNIFSRCLFKISNDKRINKNDINYSLNNTIILLSIAEYKYNINKAGIKLKKIAMKDEDIDKMMALWEENTCKILGVKQKNIIFVKNFIKNDLRYINAVKKEKLLRNDNMLKLHFKDVLDEFEAFSDMLTGIINNDFK